MAIYMYLTGVLVMEFAETCPTAKPTFGSCLPSLHLGSLLPSSWQQHPAIALSAEAQGPLVSLAVALPAHPELY